MEVFLKEVVAKKLEEVKKDHLDNWCREDTTNAQQLIKDVFRDLEKEFGLR